MQTPGKCLPIIVCTLCIALLLVLDFSPFSARGQDVGQTYQPNDVRATYSYYIPLALNRYPFIKERSGIHLGNRSQDWNAPTDFLARLKGANAGARPKAVVVLSNQLYTIQRSTSAPCNIIGASIRSSYLFSYLNRAIREGTLVVIRLWPSPGNFIDYANPGGNHTLLTGTVPAGGNYCNNRYQLYRAVNDLAAEMNEIYKLSVNSYGWPADHLFFEPANEPNTEWYYAGLIPNHDNSAAWQAMDAYFAAVYNSAKGMNQQLQVLTPPMAQGAFAEQRIFGTCQISNVVGGGSGYDHMPQTFGQKNDGFSWHNYWRQSKEIWSTANPVCASISSTTTSDHVYQYFPDWLRNNIRQASGKYAFISEADVLSPCQSPPHTLLNKDTQAVATQESIWRFISEEQGASTIITWLLTNEYADLPNGSLSPCPRTDPDYGNKEIAWHEAYRETGEREWFRQWWTREDRVLP